MQDGTIEADIAIKIIPPPGVRMPGFVGIAFRGQDGCFALRYVLPSAWEFPQRRSGDAEPLRAECGTNP